MTKEILISQITFEFKSFIAYANMNLDPSNREDAFKIDIQKQLKSSIIDKLNKISEVKSNV